MYLYLWSDWEWQLCNISFSTLREKNEAGVDISSDAKLFILCFMKEVFLYRMFWLRNFTIICNIDEYKMMGQDKSLGQLYDVQNWTMISTLPPAKLS